MLARQAAERLALGVDYGCDAYVVSNEIGEPYSRAVLSRYWRDAVKGAEVRHIKLHAARHTCATLTHLSGVPVAVIAAWIAHKDATLTMKLYTHSQAEALKAAGDTLNRVVRQSRRCRQNCRQRTNSAASTMTERASELCAPEEIRTPNLLIRSQMLYPLSYGRLSSVMSSTKTPRRREDLNLRSP